MTTLSQENRLKIEYKSRDQHILQLTEELLDDIELSRLQSEQLLLKTTRLARLVDNEEIKKWLKLEIIGYNNFDDISLKYLSLTGRWIDRAKGYAFWGPLAEQEISIQTLQNQIKVFQVPNIHYAPSSANPHEYVSGIENKMNEVVSNVMEKSDALASKLSIIGSIKSRVIGLIHNFVSTVYYERLFIDLAKSIFDQYKINIDNAITNLDSEALQKIPIVYARLSEGDPEAISQGLLTCRRIIDSFADAIFPATNDTIQTDGDTIQLGKSQIKNRINAYIDKHIQSRSRKHRLKQTLTNLYDAVSGGVHSTKDSSEAQAILLQTYLFLGEVSRLQENTRTSNE